MATIITVHGTGATGPESGSAWWQKESEFEKRLHELVESDDGALNFHSFVWDGSNSERSRRHAATRLLALVRQFEARSEKCCLLGHSHGGSIIFRALALGASRKRPLPTLTHWITVGTPFVVSRKATLLVSRLGILAKAAYICFLSYFILISAYLFEELKLATVGRTLIILAALNSPFLILHFLMWLVTRDSLVMHGPRTRERVAQWFGPRSTILWHRNDEAIQILSSLKSIEINLFKPEFFLRASALTSILLIPSLLFWAAISGWSVDVSTSPPGPAFSTAVGIPDPPEVGLPKSPPPKLTIDFRELANRAGTQLSEAYSSSKPSLMLFVLVLIAPATLFAFSVAITFMIVIVTAYISVIASLIFNNLTSRQLQYSAYGNDTEGETIYDVNPHPFLMREARPLPEPLANEISSMSDGHAALTLSKFRSEIGRIITTKPPSSDLISGYLSWRELIHTCYFSVPRFQMLVAYTVAHADGFRPSHVLENSSEYEIIARWHEEIGATLVPGR